jgi:hypothetical protein
MLLWVRNSDGVVLGAAFSILQNPFFFSLPGIRGPVPLLLFRAVVERPERLLHEYAGGTLEETQPADVSRSSP